MGSFPETYNEPEKTASISRRCHWWNERRKSMLMMHHLPDVGSTSDGVKQIFN